jgi:hypothetical protein
LTIYHFHWCMVAVMLHLQLVTCELRITILIAIFLSLATVNWQGDHRGWTYSGQPGDTINISAALSMGELVGYFAERSIREAFANNHSEKQYLKLRLQDDEELLDDLASQIVARNALLEGAACAGH